MAETSSKPPYRRGPLRTVWPSTARPLSHRAAARADEGYGRSDTPDWRNVDWPAHTHQVEVDGIPVNYVDIGEGIPVVFMVVIQHSADASAQSAWLDSSDAPSAVQWCNDGCVILTRTHFLARGRVRTASGLCLIEGSNTGNGCGGVAPLPDIDYDSTG